MIFLVFMGVAYLMFILGGIIAAAKRQKRIKEEARLRKDQRTQREMDAAIFGVGESAKRLEKATRRHYKGMK